jgi:hypothetical protein
MCVSCLLTSAVMLFTPAQGLPEPVNVAPNVMPEAISIPVQMSVAQETQIAIAEMLTYIPRSPETSLLINGLESLQTQLHGITSDDEADELIKTSLSELSTQMRLAPNSEELFDLLMQIMEQKDTQASLQTSRLQALLNNNHSNLLASNLQTNAWGWLN